MNAPAHRRRADQRGAPQVWCSPRELVAALEDRYAPDGFDLDAAANADNAIAEHWLGAGSSISEDALTVPWLLPRTSPGVTVFCNPPWNAIEPWVEHALAEVEAGHARLVVFVLPTRADTRWWASLQRGRDGVVVQMEQIEGRIAYVDPTGDGRSSPAEGTSVFVLRPQIRARELRSPKVHVLKPAHDAEGVNS